jgi:hypothetical protein
MIFRGRSVSAVASNAVRRVSTHLPPRSIVLRGDWVIMEGEASGSWGSDAGSRGIEAVFGSLRELEAPRWSSDRRGVEGSGEGSREGSGGVSCGMVSRPSGRGVGSWGGSGLSWRRVAVSRRRVSGAPRSARAESAARGRALRGAVLGQGSSSVSTEA